LPGDLVHDVSLFSDEKLPEYALTYALTPFERFFALQTLALQNPLVLNHNVT